MKYQYYNIAPFEILQVFLRCGDHNKVISVVEPTICHYELRFETPLACPIDAFLGN